MKLLEDLPDDDHVAHVRTEWYSQDLVDPLLFSTNGKEHIVPKDGMKGTVKVKSIEDDTIELEENDYYVFLASLHSSEDNVLSHEEPELTADDDLSEREEETDKQSKRPKRRRRIASPAGDFLFY